MGGHDTLFAVSKEVAPYVSCGIWVTASVPAVISVCLSITIIMTISLRIVIVPGSKRVGMLRDAMAVCKSLHEKTAPIVSG